MLGIMENKMETTVVCWGYIVGSRALRFARESGHGLGFWEARFRGLGFRASD